MHRLFFLATAFLALLMMSVLTPAAHAYMTPDQVIFSDEFLYPPKPAEARKRVQAQNDAAAAAREAVYADLAAERDAQKTQTASNTADASSGSDQDILAHLAAIIEAMQQGDSGTGTPTVADGTDSELAPEERRRERLLERLDERDADRLHGAAPYSSYYASVEQFHGGAPLADTGMGTYAAIGLGALAVFWTLRRAAKKGHIKIEY